MQRAKSIDSIFLFLIFSLFSINIFTYFFIGNTNNTFRYFLILVFVIYSIIILAFANIKRIKTNFSILGISIFSYLIMGLIFRHIRDYFSKPSLKDSSVIGFSQYFGYPLFFDIFLFCFIIFIPLVSYYLIRTKNK